MPTLKEPNGLKKGRRLDDLEHKSIEEDDYKPKLKDSSSGCSISPANWPRCAAR